MQQPQEDEANRHRHQTDHAKLFVRQFGQRLESASPSLRRYKRQDALDYEHQRARCQQNGGE